MVDLNIFKRHREELVGLMLDHVSEMGAHRTEEEMIERRYAEIEELMEKLRHQKRALDHMTGKEVPPELQFGKAVVTGFGGGV